MTSSPFPRGRHDDIEDPDSSGLSVAFYGGSDRHPLGSPGGSGLPATSTPVRIPAGRWIGCLGGFSTWIKNYIQCANHAALFSIADGVCVYMPCAGHHLAPVPMAVEAGEVVLLVADAVAGITQV
jgi:hypothetical protein